MQIDLTELYPLQAGLDKDIASRHNVTYESTNNKRILSLLVEIGEFANETRCFKYWSTKGPSAKEVILDEFADGMHFFISLGIPLNVRQKIYDLVDDGKPLTESILEVYDLILFFNKKQDEENYVKAFQGFLNLLIKLGFSDMDAINAYKKKLEVNYTRQKTAY